MDWKWQMRANTQAFDYIETVRGDTSLSFFEYGTLSRTSYVSKRAC